MVAGLSETRRRSVSVLARTRSSSWSGNAGFMATSPSTARVSRQVEVSPSEVIRMRSRLATARIWLPRNSHFVGDLAGVAGGGSFGQHGGGQLGYAGPVRRVVRGAGAYDEAEGDGGYATSLDVQDVEAVVQPRPVGDGGGEGGLRGGGGHGVALYGGCGSGTLGFGVDGELDPGLSESGGGTAHVFGGDGHVSVEVLVDEGGIAGVGVVVVELVGASAEAAGAFELEDVGRLNAIPGSLNFALGDVAGAYVVKLAEQFGFEFVQGVVGVGGCLNHELAGYFLVVVIDLRLAGGTAFIDEGAVEARTASAAEYLGEDVEGGLLVGEGGDGGPGHVEAGELHAVVGCDFHRAGEGGVHPDGAFDLGAGRDVSEVVFDEGAGVVWVEVADYGEAGVVRGVEAAEEGFHVVEGCVVEVFGGADGGPVVGVRRGEDGGLEHHVGHAVGPVFVVLATLVLHYVALDV